MMVDALTEKEIDEIEKAIGLPLPPDVKEKYRVSNGLHGPTDCWLLYTYNESEDSDIVHNNTLREEEWFPKVFKSIVLLGNDGCGNLICYDWHRQEAILWNPSDGEWVQERRNTVVEIWAYIEEFYANPL
jgi:hypothetical protein